MKCSKALLNDAEIGEKLFLADVEKSKDFLKFVFGEDSFTNGFEPVLISMDAKVFTGKLSVGEREVFATQTYESTQGDLMQPVLILTESTTQKLTVSELSPDYDTAVNEVMDLLEGEYGLNFTPLDPEDKDEHIKRVQYRKDDRTMEVIFTHEDHEATFTAVFRFADAGESFLTVRQDKRHVVCLD